MERREREGWREGREGRVKNSEMKIIILNIMKGKKGESERRYPLVLVLLLLLLLW